MKTIFPYAIIALAAVFVIYTISQGMFLFWVVFGIFGIAGFNVYTSILDNYHKRQLPHTKTL